MRILVFDALVFSGASLEEPFFCHGCILVTYNKFQSTDMS